MARKSTDNVGFRLRWDERLRRRIEKAALQNDRPMNAEVLARLEASFAREETADLIKQAVSASVDHYTSVFGEMLQRDVKTMGQPFNDGIVWAALIKAGLPKAEATRILEVLQESGLVRKGKPAKQEE